SGAAMMAATVRKAWLSAKPVVSNKREAQGPRARAVRWSDVGEEAAPAGSARVESARKLMGRRGCLGAEPNRPREKLLVARGTLRSRGCFQESTKPFALSLSKCRPGLRSF